MVQLFVIVIMGLVCDSIYVIVMSKGFNPKVFSFLQALLLFFCWFTSVDSSLY